MNIVHMQTTIQTTFGVVDDDDNAIAQQPIVVTVQRFSPEAFQEAYDAIAKARDEALASSEPEPSRLSVATQPERSSLG